MYYHLNIGKYESVSGFYYDIHYWPVKGRSLLSPLIVKPNYTAIYIDTSCPMYIKINERKEM